MTDNPLETTERERADALRWIPATMDEDGLILVHGDRVMALLRDFERETARADSAEARTR